MSIVFARNTISGISIDNEGVKSRLEVFEIENAFLFESKRACAMSSPQVGIAVVLSILKIVLNELGRTSSRFVFMWLEALRYGLCLHSGLLIYMVFHT